MERKEIDKTERKLELKKQQNHLHLLVKSWRENSLRIRTGKQQVRGKFGRNGQGRSRIPLCWKENPKTDNKDLQYWAFVFSLTGQPSLMPPAKQHPLSTRLCATQAMQVKRHLQRSHSILFLVNLYLKNPNPQFLNPKPTLSKVIISRG